jgi:hypothetical protein
MYKRNVSADKPVESFSHRMFLYAHIINEDKNGDRNDSCMRIQRFGELPKYHTNILLGNFNTKYFLNENRERLSILKY